MSSICDPKDIALKSFFLGPQAENGPWIRDLVQQMLSSWFEWRRFINADDGCAISEADRAEPEFVRRRADFEANLRELMGRFEKEVPKFSPRYIGHMFSDVSLPALMGHFVALLHNPNNISHESSRVGVDIEDEAIEALRSMVGYQSQKGAGHFTSGGTVANLEALIRARSRCALWLSAGAASRAESESLGRAGLFEAAHMGWKSFAAQMKQLSSIEATQEWNFVDGNPWRVAPALGRVFGEAFSGPVVLIPENKHYSWKKGISYLGLGDEAFWGIRLDEKGKLSLADLAAKLERAASERRPVMMVVSVAGTTELGTLDPVCEVQDLLDEWRLRRGIHIWHHVDAAYGGFFCSFKERAAEVLGEKAAQDLKSISRVESVTLDPHKLGYVPYASGAFLAREREDYVTRAFGGPYVQFDPQRDKGLFTLEGSRSAAGATATWLTERTIGFNADGYGRVLARTVLAKRKLEEDLKRLEPLVRLAPFTETNIVAFHLANDGESLSVSNERTDAIVRAFSPGSQGEFIVSKTELGFGAYEEYLGAYTAAWGAHRDSEKVTLVRLCMMNPFFSSIEMNVDFSKQFVEALSSSLALKSS